MDSKNKTSVPCQDTVSKDTDSPVPSTQHDSSENVQTGSLKDNTKHDKKHASGKGGSTFAEKLNSMVGGGDQGENDEDALDKAVDFAQEKVLGEGQQQDETAAEQAKDELVTDAIRNKYKDLTGKNIPIEDKDKKLGA